MDWSGALRDTLRAHAVEWADQSGTLHYNSRGQPPTILFEQAPDGLSHGNFQPNAWRAIMNNAGWGARLNKPHSQSDALPADKAESACELDSSNSSDALLMNCFCFPGALQRILDGLDIAEADEQIEFGYKAKVPLVDGAADATEIDMRIGSTLFEAKLTEKDFTARPRDHVLRYRDLETVFEISALRSEAGQVSGYQLIRNVLAAAHHHSRLIVLLDQRRPDLLEEWWQVHSAITSTALRLRCGFRTWQQLAAASPPVLARFLSVKYGL